MDQNVPNVLETCNIFDMALYVHHLVWIQWIKEKFCASYDRYELLSNCRYLGRTGPVKLS